MARINDNLLVKGAGGNVGKQYVYRKHGNDTHIAKMPTFNKQKEATERQVQVRDLFTTSSLYTKGAMTNPELKKEYGK